MKSLSKLSFIFVVLGAVGFAQSQNPSAPPEQGPPPRHHMMGMGPGMPMGMGVPGDWWRNSDIAQQINLSDAQTQQLSQIFSNHRATLIQLRGNVENDEGKLRDLLDQDQPPQQEQVLAQVAQFQTDRNALETEFTKMSLEFRNKLTPDQWKKLRSVAKEHMSFGHHRGGPGGNPPPPPQ